MSACDPSRTKRSGQIHTIAPEIRQETGNDGASRHRSWRLTSFSRFAPTAPLDANEKGRAVAALSPNMALLIADHQSRISVTRIVKPIANGNAPSMPPIKSNIQLRAPGLADRRNIKRNSTHIGMTVIRTASPRSAPNTTFVRDRSSVPYLAIYLVTASPVSISP